MLQGEGDATAKGKVRGKKASSKYNEEISSESETEGWVAKLWVPNYIVLRWTTDCNGHNCVLFRSPEAPRKRQSQEERDYGETPQEKKLRLAKLYLDQLKEEGEPRVVPHMGLFWQVGIRWRFYFSYVFSAEENKAENDSFEADLIAGRLQEEVVRLGSFLSSSASIDHNNYCCRQTF